MSNIIDYVKEYGNLTMEEYPFNNVDSLILCQLAYLKFENSFLDVEGEIIEITQFENQIELLTKDTRVPLQNQELFSCLIHSLRFSHMFISNLSYNFDKVYEKQFCAITFHLSNQTDYIAFRGTDASFVGWKEDFNLSFQENIPSQISALHYVDSYQTKHTLILGGHSKGGNLAIYAGTHSKNKIHAIYNHDGPGFLKPDSTSILIYKTIPQSSIIGLLMEESNAYQIVLSNGISILQHDPFTWLVENGDFIYLEQNDILSKRTQSTIKEWLTQIDIQTRKQVIDTIYSIFSKYENPKDLKENLDIIDILKSIENIDPNTKKMILKTMRILLKCIQNEMKQG